MATKKVPSSMVAKQTAKVKQVKKISGSASGAAPKPSNNMLKGASKVGKRVGTVAREARDIVTAVSTAADLRGSTRADKNYARKNVGKQITETVKAVTSGKRGTRSGQAIKRGDVKVVKLYGTPTDVRLYGTGKERKKRK